MKPRRSATAFLIILLILNTTGILSLFLVERACAYIQSGTISVAPSTNAAEVDSTFTVRIDIDKDGDGWTGEVFETVRSWAFKLKFDTAILTTNKDMITLGEETYFTKNGIKPGDQNLAVSVEATGYIDAANTIIPRDAVTSDGTLLYITFKVIDTGKVDLVIYDSFLYDIDFQLIAGPEEFTELHGVFYTHTPHASFYYMPSTSGAPSYPDPALRRYPIVGEAITFNASAYVEGGKYKGSYDPDGGTITSYSWDFDDGQTATGVVVTHSYLDARSYLVNLAVTDNEMRTDTHEVSVLVQKHDVAITSIRPSPTAVSPGEKVSIKVTIKNLGSTDEWVNVTLYHRLDSVDTLIPYNMTPPLIRPAFSNYYEEDPVTHSAHLNFPAGGKIVVNYTWPTRADTTEGEYNLWANISLYNPNTRLFENHLEYNMTNNMLLWDGKLKVFKLHNVGVQDIKLSPTLPATIEQPVFVKYGTQVSIKVNVTNTGNFDEVFYVTLYLNSSVLYNWTDISLTKKNSTVLPTFTWNTTELPSPVDRPLNYTLKAVASNVTNEVEMDRTEDNTLELKVTTTFPPLASFTYSPTNPVVNQGITFDATPSTPSLGQRIVKYEWKVEKIVDTQRIADGTLDPNKTPQRTFTVSAKRNVTLTVTDSWKLTNSTSRLMYVGDAPVANFTYSPVHPKVGDTVTFNATFSHDQDDKIVNYAWVFGDSQTGIGNITTHVYTALGNYNVTLTVTDELDHKATALQTVTVIKGPVASFTFSPSTPLVDQPVTFNASSSLPNGGSIASYSWDFGDGSKVTTTDPVQVHVFNKGGNFLVALTVTDTEGLESNATGSIIIKKRDSTISIAASPLTLVLGQTTTLNGQIQPTGAGRANIQVAIWYKKETEITWGLIYNVTTGAAGRYEYAWTPTATGTYQIKASWNGDDKFNGDESDPLPVTVQETFSTAPSNLYLYAVVGAVAIFVIIGVAFYFIRRRKPTEPASLETS